MLDTANIEVKDLGCRGSAALLPTGKRRRRSLPSHVLAHSATLRGPRTWLEPRTAWAAAARVRQPQLTT